MGLVKEKKKNCPWPSRAGREPFGLEELTFVWLFPHNYKRCAAGRGLIIN